MTPAARDLLDPATLARISDYALLARTAVEGFLSGLHRSIFHGFGTEFLQYRSYSPGDDPKYLDWKVLARRDRLYTKVYEEETNMHLFLLVDASASLDYRGARAPVSKHHYACMLAACLAYLAQRQGDNLGLCLYADDILEVVDPGHRSERLARTLHALARHRPQGHARHDIALDYLDNHLRARSLVVLISDLLETGDELAERLARLQHRHSECLALQILDQDELDLPLHEGVRFIDLESAAEINTSPKQIAAQYNDSMAAFQRDLAARLSRRAVDQVTLTTEQSLGHALAHYLHRRETIR